jgi:hypothetical protein
MRAMGGRPASCSRHAALQQAAASAEAHATTAHAQNPLLVPHWPRARPTLQGSCPSAAHAPGSTCDQAGNRAAHREKHRRGYESTVMAVAMRWACSFITAASIQKPSQQPQWSQHRRGPALLPQQRRPAACARCTPTPSPSEHCTLLHERCRLHRPQQCALHNHGPLLPPPAARQLPGSYPPGVQQHHVAGSGQVERHAAGLEAHQEDTDLGGLRCRVEGLWFGA